MIADGNRELKSHPLADSTAERQREIKRMESSRRVALLVLNASDWSRRVHEGIAAFAREAGDWYCWMQPRGLTDLFELPENWQGEGIIGRFADPAKTDLILKRGLPAVNISWHREHTSELPKVNSDQFACGKLCAEFYRDRGFEHVGYVGPQSFLQYEDKIIPAIEQVCEEAGITLNRFQPSVTAAAPDLESHRQALDAWIESLPKPIGIITWSTIIAREMIISALNLGLSVPNDVALLAVEHDPLLSTLSPLPISHVLQRPQVVGFEAARLLQHLMNGGSPPAEPILIAPEGIAETISTHTMFANDEVVQEAIRFIQDHLSEPIQVADLTRHLNISRRSLEERFRKVLNRSPAEEIRNARINELKRLLRNTQLPLCEIAYRCGFSYTEVMIRFFKKATGQTPRSYRRGSAELASLS